MAVVLQAVDCTEGATALGRRAFLRAEALREIGALGGARPALWAFTASQALRVDLNRLGREQPEAHPGATLAGLARSDGVVGVGATATLVFEDPDGHHARSAVLFEAAAGVVGWWTAVVPFVTDPTSGVGAPGPGTEQEPRDVTELLPFARDLVLVPPAAVAGRLLPPSRGLPEVQAAWHELAPTAKLPEDPGQQAEFSAALVLSSALAQGPGWIWAVKQAGRTVQIWKIAQGSPVSTDDLLRSLANEEAEADGVALLRGELWEGGLPRRRGIQVVAQRGRGRAERWYLLRFDDPSGPVVDRIVGRPLPDAAKGEGWLDESPEVALRLGSGGPEA